VIGVLVTENNLSKNKLSYSKRFSISVQKTVRYSWSLCLNSCSSWNLYGRKDNRLCSTLHTVMWETSPNSLPACLVDFCRPRRDDTWTCSTISTLRHVHKFLFLTQMQPVLANDVPRINGFSHRCFRTTIHKTPPLNHCRRMVLFELQHTIVSRVNKVRHSDGRLQRTKWWPRVLDFKWCKTWNCWQMLC